MRVLFSKTLTLSTYISNNGARHAKGMMLFEKKVLSCSTFHILQEIKKQSDRNMADEKIIFSMNGVGKVLPNSNKVIQSSFQ